jgi:LPXTG-motif cell wall-anchored protein
VIGPVAHTPSPAPKPAAQAVEQTRTTGLDQPLALDLTGRTGSPTHVRVVAGPEHGTVVLSPNGTAVYTPDSGFSGADDFTYAFTGGSGVAVTGTMHIRVGSGLPRTGAEVGHAVGAGGLLVIFGLLLLVVGRRRTRDDETV